MVTKYPAAIDNNQTLTPIADGRPATGGSVEQLRQAIIAIEEELGVKPSGVYATVRARLDSLENIVGNLRIIELDQDLGGSLEDPRVIGIHGRPISDVPPGLGQVYIWNGIAWVPGSPPAEITFAGDLTGTPVSQTVVGINTIPVEQGDESNVGQFLKLVQETSGFITANHYDGQNLWLLGLNSNQLYKVNSAIPSLVSTIELPFENINSLGSGLGNWITSDATHIYVAIITSDVGSAGKVYIIEKATGNIVGRVDSNWNQDPKYIYNVIVNGDDIIIATGSAGDFSDGADGYIEKYSKTEALAAYPSPAIRQGVLTGIGIGAGCLCIAVNEGTPKLFATSYQLNTLYRIDIDSLTVEDSFSTENMSNCTVQPGGQYVWVTGYQDVVAGPILVARFNIGSINSGPVTVSSPLGANYRYITADNEGVWTSSPESSTIHRLSEDTFDIIASPSNSPVTYTHLTSDGTWLWASQQIAVGTPGVDAFSTSLGTEAYDHHFVPVSGALSLVYADAGGDGAPSSIFIYQPSGTSSTNVFTSWSSLMSARNGVIGPATIVIDDTFESPAIIDEGEWNLGENTKITGVLSSNNFEPNRAIMLIPPNASLQNPSEFENIRIMVSKWSEDIGGLQWNNDELKHLLIMRNAHLQDGQNGLGSGKAILIGGEGATIEMYGSSELENDDNFNPIYIEFGANLTINAYDSSIIRDGLFTGDEGNSANVNVYSDGVMLDDRLGFVESLTINYYTPGPLIYQPCGGGSGQKRVLTEWKNVVNAASTIPGTKVILIDDSIISPAQIELGDVWNCYELELHGRKGPQTDPTLRTQLFLPDGVQLQRPFGFKDLYITAENSSDCSIVGVPGLPEIPWSFFVENTLFENIGISGFAVIRTTGGVIDLRGDTRFGVFDDDGGKYILTTDSSFDNTVVINMHENSVIDENAIVTSDENVTLIFNTSDGSLLGQQPNIGIPSSTVHYNPIHTTPRTQLFTDINMKTIRPQNYESILSPESEGSINFGSLSSMTEGNPGEFPNWSATLSGRDHTITGGQFNVIIGGEDNHLFNCNYCIIGGHGIGMSDATSCVVLGEGGAGGTWSGAFAGISGFANAFGAVVMGGTNAQASGDSSAVVAGDQGSASGYTSIVLAGVQNSAQGEASVAMGHQADAFRNGQLSHGAAQHRGFGRFIATGVSNNTTPTEMRMALEEGQTYAMRVTCVASREHDFLATPEGRAMYIHTLLVHMDDGIVVIDDDELTYSFAVGTDTNLWTFVLSEDSPDLVATFTGSFFASASVVNVTTTFEWTEVDELF